MSDRDASPAPVSVSELFGSAIDASASWVGLARKGIVVRANRSFREALADAGTSDLNVLLPCWREHAGPSTAMSCPCPGLSGKPANPSAYCQAGTGRFPARIASSHVSTPDARQGLRVVVIEPRRELPGAEPAQLVMHALTRVRGALDQVERHLISELHTGEAPLRPHGLSRREWDVAQGLASGKRAPAVAASLGISVHTVRNHLKSVFRKLNVSTQSELRRRLSRARHASPGGEGHGR